MVDLTEDEKLFLAKVRMHFARYYSVENIKKLDRILRKIDIKL